MATVYSRRCSTSDSDAIAADIASFRFTAIDCAGQGVALEDYAIDSSRTGQAIATAEGTEAALFYSQAVVPDSTARTDTGDDTGQGAALDDHVLARHVLFTRNLTIDVNRPVGCCKGKACCMECRIRNLQAQVWCRRDGLHGVGIGHRLPWDDG